MSKTVTIPNIGANPYVVELNGVRYGYPAGTEQTVPDAVAAIIANDMALRPQEDPAARYKRNATIWDVMQMLDGADTALRALEERVEAVEKVGNCIVESDAQLQDDGSIYVANLKKAPNEVQEAVNAHRPVTLRLSLMIDNNTIAVYLPLKQWLGYQGEFIGFVSSDEDGINGAYVDVLIVDGSWSASGRVFTIPKELINA